MRLFNLPIDLLQEHNPQDENFTDLKAQKDKWIADTKASDAYKAGKNPVLKWFIETDENWFARTVVGFVFMFLRVKILKWMNPASGSSPKKYTPDDNAKAAKMFDKFKEMMAEEAE
jgi:hypothetical protein